MNAPDTTITCPQCKASIPLTESLAAPLLASARQQFDMQLAAKDAEIQSRKAAITKQWDEIAKAKATIQEQVNELLKQERAAIEATANKNARLLIGSELDNKKQELAELQEVLKVRDEKLAEAQKAQAEVLRMKRELDDAKREMDLTIEQRVQASSEAIRVKAKRDAEDDLQLKVAESEKTIADMGKQIDELRRRAEQGSQQLQGDVQELALETILKSKFPRDTVEPVPIGVHGGDLLHRVFGELPGCCGTIIWESKRTKNWSDGWLVKLRDNQRAAQAEVAVIVSQALPKDVDTFHHVDGVWVTSPRTVIPLTLALRQSLIELSLARQAGEGQQTKMEMVYQYLSGPRFRQRVQAIVEAFSTMQDDLAKEKKAITKQWAKREEQIERVMIATVGMYGDLQGIAGQSFQEIEGLELKALEE